MPGVETTPNPSFASAARVRARRRGNTLQRIAPKRSSPLLADRAPRIWRGNAIGYIKEGLGEVSTQNVNITQAIRNHPYPLFLWYLQIGFEGCVGYAGLDDGPEMVHDLGADGIEHAHLRLTLGKLAQVVVL